MTNTEELERIISESGLKKSYIAKAINLSRQGFKNKCENKNTFTSTEIAMLCEILNITKLTDKERIFFAKSVI
jgi:hypothetical protein